MNTTLIHTPEQMLRQAAIWRQAGKKVAFVPTLGALHSGHLSLMELAKQQADHVVVSIFVNPLQFGPGEDLESYPRHEARDAARVNTMGVDALYLPKVEAMYPEGFCTQVQIEELGDRLCGKFRPGHFNGVLTVVLKLLMQVAPQIAIFGEKDFQQLQIIRRMVQDFCLPVEILAGPTLRENDGLALSSRNEYLSPQDRKIAPQLYAVLQAVAAELKRNTRTVAEVLAEGTQKLLSSGFDRVDYLELCDPRDLSPVSSLTAPARLCVAAHLGKTRLIDNIAVE